MDRSQAEAFLGDHIGPMARFVGLEDWKIGYRVGECPNGWAAMCERQGEYRVAHLTFDAEKYNDFDDLLESIWHEMAHCILWPFDLYRDATTPPAGDAVSDKKEHMLYRYTIEMMINNLDWIWKHRLKDAYLEFATS